MANLPTQSSPSTSASLIRRAQHEDRQAWELAQIYGPVVYTWAVRQGLQPNDASDIMQDVFHSLTQKLHTFNPSKGPFRGWLWTVTRNQVLDQFRVAKHKHPAPGGTAAYEHSLRMPESPPASESGDGLAEIRGTYRRAVELMKTDFEPQTWQAFWRTTVNGEQAAAVARDLGISKWTVYKARSRVLQRLREEFADLLE